MISPIKNTMYTVVSYLVGYIGTTITKNTARHMQLYVLPDVFADKCSSFKFVTGLFCSMCVAKILEIAFPCLVAYRAIQWMINKQEFHYPFSGVDHFFTGDIF